MPVVLLVDARAGRWNRCPEVYYIVLSESLKSNQPERFTEMKPIRLLFVTVFFLSLVPTVFAQVSRGTVLEGLKINSGLLGREVEYTVYLPFDYDSSDRFYPVVYLLHGYSDDDTGWIQFGEAHLIADEGIAERKIPPMILVMPDAGVSWYVNNHDGSVRYEDFFFEEFLPHIESQYRIRSEKRYRAISGLSMGGYGALIYAMHHPELFAACAPFSAAVYTDEETLEKDAARWDRIDSVVFGPDLQGEARLTDHYRVNNPLHLVESEEPEALRSVRYFIDCGDDDFLFRGNAMLHIALRDREIPHEYRVRNGGHQWSYWRSGLLDALEFIGTSFHQP